METHHRLDLKQAARAQERRNMLKTKDKIFTNLYGDQSYSLKDAQLRGDWDQTSDFIKIFL